jgi:hypothetical protein
METFLGLLWFEGSGGDGNVYRAVRQGLNATTCPQARHNFKIQAWRSGSVGFAHSLQELEAGAGSADAKRLRAGASKTRDQKNERGDGHPYLRSKILCHLVSPVEKNLPEKQAITVRIIRTTL